MGSGANTNYHINILKLSHQHGDTALTWPPVTGYSMDINIELDRRTHQDYFWLNFIDNIYPEEKYMNTMSLK